MASVLLTFLVILLAFPNIHSLKVTPRLQSNPCKPEQIHLALSDSYTPNPASSSPIKAIFHTQEPCDSAYISLETLSGFEKIIATSVNYFEDTYSDKLYSTYVHIFDFPALEPGQVYEYTCHSDANDTHSPQGPFNFYVPNPQFDGQSTSVIMFGDLDNSADGQSTMTSLNGIKDTNFTSVAAYIHMGDIAYDLEGKGGKRGDDFMNAIQTFAASIPYMISPGNHETYNNFSNVNMRFKMPLFSETQNHYYSYNIGNMHFATINLDLVILYPELMQYMADWLANDLEQANLNRNERPWIIVYTHRPLYCSKPGNDDCDNNAARYKVIEDIINKYKVDLYVSGHVHAYERMLPVYRGNVSNFQHDANDKHFRKIYNAQAPVYLMHGKAGHDGDKDDSKPYDPKPYSVTVDTKYSYMAVHSLNNTHLHVENIGSDKQKILDEFYLIKDCESFAHLPFYKEEFEVEEIDIEVEIFVNGFLPIKKQKRKQQFK